MKRLLIYFIFLVISGVLTFATTIVGYHTPETIVVSASDSIPLDVAGFPLYYFIGSTSNTTVVVWGHLAIDILFWFLIVIMIAKAWDLVNQTSKQT